MTRNVRRLSGINCCYLLDPRNNRKCVCWSISKHKRNLPKPVIPDTFVGQLTKRL